MKFKPVFEWKRTHLRNIDIALMIANGKNYKQTSVIFDIGARRVAMIYRKLMAKLCEKQFNVTYINALHDKKYYNCSERINMLEKYKFDYLKDVSSETSKVD